MSSAVFTYGRALNVRALPITGGQPYHKQTRRLQQGVDIVVATPGRLVDLLNQNLIDLSHVETVVLDEADEMLSMGFADDLETILQATPSSRQTALLSATLPTRIRQIAGTYLNDPETIAVADGDRTAEAIEQRAYLVRGRDKLAALVRLIETDDVTSALAFVRTREATSRLAADLSELGYAAEPISGELSQGARTAVLSRFKQQRIRILVATDVAARGLDIDHVSHVFNVDLPIDSEAYVHRVGRTGRAGRDGTALSLVDPRERGPAPPRRALRQARDPVRRAPVDRRRRGRPPGRVWPRRSPRRSTRRPTPTGTWSSTWSRPARTRCGSPRRPSRSLARPAPRSPSSPSRSSTTGPRTAAPRAAPRAAARPTAATGTRVRTATSAWRSTRAATPASCRARS